MSTSSSAPGSQVSRGRRTRAAKLSSAVRAELRKLTNLVTNRRNGVGGTAKGRDRCSMGATFSVAMTASIDKQLVDHLVRPDGQEDLTFALYQPSTGATRSTALLVEVVLPEPGEREVHGNASFTGSYFLRAAGIAAERDLGLALLHSHPGGTGWQCLSPDDRAAEAGHAHQAMVLTELPLVGLTLATSDRSYSARRWHSSAESPRQREGRQQEAPTWVDEQAVSVRVVGDRLRVSFNDDLVPPPVQTRRTLRTVQAWGNRAHRDLVRLRVGVVGAGSVGQLVAEALERTGFAHVDIFDFDIIGEHNLDRLVHATASDIGAQKVEVLLERLRLSASTPGAVVHGYDDSIVEPAGWAHALDCDILFSCVDRPWPRFALNVAAYAHFIPVVDGGVAVDAVLPDDGEDAVGALAEEMPEDVHLVGAEWRAHVVGPDRKCLECLKQYDAGDVGLDRSGLLDAPGYIASLPRDHRLRRGENVFTFSMACASAEVLELLRAVLAPSQMGDVGATLTHWTTATTDRDVDECVPGCPFSGDLLGRGDATGVDVTGPHPAAVQARATARARRSRRAWRHPAPREAVRQD